MEDFYDSIKDNLENRPEPSFREDAWRAMEAKLDHFEKSQIRLVVWPWWSYALLAVLPLSILLNAWLFLQRTVDSGSLTLSENKVDTIVKTQLIYLTDTLLQTQVVKQLIPRPASVHIQSWPPRFAADLQGAVSPFGSTQKAPAFGSRIMERFAQGQGGGIHLLSLRENLGPTALVNTQEADLKSRDDVASLLIGKKNLLHRPQSTSREAMKGLPISSYSYTPPPVWEYFRPQGISIGAQIGGLIPLTEDIAEPYAFQRAIQLKLQLPNRWAVWGEIGLLDIRYRMSETGERVGLPSVAPPADNFDFQHVQVWQERTDLSVGLEYAFTSNKRRERPTVGLGYNALGFRPYEVFYEFKDQNTDTDIQVEKNIDMTDGTVHYLNSKAGYQWPIGQQVIWDLSLNYRYRLNDNRFTNPNMLGLTTSFSVRF